MLRVIVPHAIALVLIAFGALSVFFNWVCLYSSWRHGRLYSRVPFVAVLFLGPGMLMIPATRPYAWLALLIDIGTLEVLPALPRLIGEIWSTSRFNLVRAYVGQSDDHEVRLRLYRKGVFVLEQDFHPARRAPGPYKVSTSGTWNWQDDCLFLVQADKRANFRPLRGVAYEAILQDSGSVPLEEGFLSLTGIELRLLFARADHRFND